MIIRTYSPEDLPQILSLFYDTVHTVCQNDYSRQQLDAWAPKEPDIALWRQTLSSHYTLVAEENGHILAFADLAEPDYLDRLYVHKDAQRRGIARSLVRLLEERASRLGARRISVHASLTAKGFFIHQNYQLVREQFPVKHGITMVNFLMVREL